MRQRPMKPTNLRRATGGFTFLVRLRAAGIITGLVLASQPGSAAIPETPRRIAGTEQVEVSLVLIDIVVRDRKDQPVSSLTRDDFELRIDGIAVDPTDIESFEEICGETPAVPASAAAASPPPATPSVASSTGSPAAPRYIIIYFDFAHMSMSGARLAMRGARDHVTQHLNPADRVMILAYKNGLRLVQDFTSDAALLVSRIDAMRADPATIETEVGEEDANALEVLSAPCLDDTCSSRRAAASARAIREEMRGRGSLEALTTLMPALAGLKGRKAVILFTEVLREEPGAEYFVFTPISPGQEGISLESEMLRLSSEANAAGVSFYTVHSAGLTAGDAGTDPIALSRSAGNASARALQTTLANETGGRALANSNNLGAILTSASRDLSCYYLLGYRYRGRGDNKRHSVQVKLIPGRQAKSRSGLTVRHRSWFSDQSAGDRRDRLVRSALLAPALYHALPVAAEAYALAPTQPGHTAGAGRPVLIKVIVPLAELPLVPTDEARLEGRIALRGRVTTREGKQVCDFDHEMPLRIPRDELKATRLVYETGCVLAPDVYTLSVTAFDPSTMEIGAHLAPLIVLKPETVDGAYLSELYLWTREQDALLVTSGLGSIGLTDSVSTRGLIPQPQRRMDGERDAVLSFTVCLPAPAEDVAVNPLRVRRALLGDADVKVSDFEELILSDPPDAETGCHQLSTAIRGGTLGAGVYKFQVEVSGANLKAPIRREVDLAVVSLP